MNKSRHTPIHPHNTIVFKLYARHARCQQDVGQRLKRNTTGYVFRYNSTIKHLQKRGGGEAIFKTFVWAKTFQVFRTAWLSFSFLCYTTLRHLGNPSSTFRTNAVPSHSRFFNSQTNGLNTKAILSRNVGNLLPNEEAS